MARVEFLANGSEVGEDASPPYEFTWMDPPAGGYTLVARAIDDDAAATSSSAVSITVQGPSGGGSSLYRAIDLGGGPVTIDGVAWESGTAANVRITGNAYTNQTTAVDPPTDAARTSMLRSFVWASSLSGVSLLAVPAGTYDVYLTIWEDNRSATMDVRVEGQLVRQGYQSGAAGHWERLGPFRVSLSDGSLDVTAGRDANLSGLEVFAAGGA